MSRLRGYGGDDGRSFPRVSGDEPGNKGVTFGLEKFSPRERG